MCGIVGVIAKSNFGFTKQPEDSFFEMLYVDALRGFDSTGIVGVEKDTTFHIAKEASSADWFISDLKVNHKEIPLAMWNRGKMYIGHNRKKTSGSVKDETAHPFVIDDWFALVHNGTLWNHKQLADTEVDSEAFAIHVAKAVDEADGDREKLKKLMDKALGDVNGAYATVFYDQKRHRVHFLRNKERPLSLVETDNALFFMSESLMGAWILARNGYKYDGLKFDHLPEHMLVTVDLDNNKMWRDQLSPKKSYTQSNNNSSMLPWVGGGACAANGGETTRTRGAVTAGKTGKYAKEEKDLRRFRKNWLGKRISFWADDLVEKNFPLTIEKGETEVTLMGGHDEIEYRHTIYAEIDMGQLGLRYEEDLFNNKWTGVIESVSVSKGGMLQIHLQEGAKPVVPSLKGQVSNKDIHAARQWRINISRLTSEELHVYYEENKHQLETWQTSAINGELAFRAGIRTVEQAAEVAKKRGNGAILKQEEKGGRFVYTDDEGRIYYETAIVVH